MVDFIIFSMISVLFLGFGIYCIYAKKTKPFGFWANAEQFEVKNVKLYNKDVGKLFICYAVVLEILGLPLFAGQNSPFVIITILGMVFSAIALMVVYITVIEPKYKTTRIKF